MLLFGKKNTFVIQYFVYIFYFEKMLTLIIGPSPSNAEYTQYSDSRVQVLSQVLADP